MGEFRSFVELLRSPAAQDVASPESSVARATEEPAISTTLALPLEDLRLFRLHAVEAFERARDRLIRRFAEDVLARELAISPPDIEALARRALAEFAGEEIVSLAVSERDAAHLRVDVPVRADAALESGDLVVEVRDGCLASPLRLRLERALGDLSLELETA